MEWAPILLILPCAPRPMMVFSTCSTSKLFLLASMPIQQDFLIQGNYIARKKNLLLLTRISSSYDAGAHVSWSTTECHQQTAGYSCYAYTCTHDNRSDPTNLE